MNTAPQEGTSLPSVEPSQPEIESYRQVCEGGSLFATMSSSEVTRGRITLLSGAQGAMSQATRTVSDFTQNLLEGTVETGGGAIVSETSEDSLGMKSSAALYSVYEGVGDVAGGSSIGRDITTFSGIFPSAGFTHLGEETRVADWAELNDATGASTRVGDGTTRWFGTSTEIKDDGTTGVYNSDGEGSVQTITNTFGDQLLITETETGYMALYDGDNLSSSREYIVISGTTTSVNEVNGDTGGLRYEVVGHYVEEKHACADPSMTLGDPGCLEDVTFSDLYVRATTLKTLVAEE